MVNPWQGARQPSICRKVIRLADEKERQKAMQSLIGALPYRGGRVMSLEADRNPEEPYLYAIVACIDHE